MGITGNLAAIANPPHLTAAFVIVAPTSLKNASFIGGAFKQKDSGDWSRDQGVAEDVIAKNAASYPASAEYAALDIQRNAEFIDIPIYNYGGWYDIFNEGSVRNFMKLQHEGSKGAQGNQKLEMGPFGHGELSGDLEYPDTARHSRQSDGDPLVRLLAEGHRQRHHERAAGEGLHDGLGAQGRGLGEEPLDDVRRLAAGAGCGELFPRHGRQAGDARRRRRRLRRRPMRSIRRSRWSRSAGRT